ncbi:MAG: radical SAM protein [Bacillota bacterium]
MNEAIFQIGPIRPPSEANSLLLRVTQNCPWNRCKFCTLYKDTKFHARPVETLKKEIDLIAKHRDLIAPYIPNIKTDIEKVRTIFNALPTQDEMSCFQMVFRWMTEGNSQAIFLQDANTMVLKTEWLAEVISYVMEKLPELRRVTSYGRANTLAKITEEDFRILAKAGLNRIHSGYETGSDRLLTMIGKGGTQEDEIIGGKKVRASGIELSIYFMPGVGGALYSDENAIETAKVINEVNPDFVRLRTFVAKRNSPMMELIKSGEHVEMRDIDKLREIRLMLAHVDPKKATGTLKSDHIINLLQHVEGNLSEDLQYMKDYIDGFFKLPEMAQRKYQMARLMGFSGQYSELEYLNAVQQNRINEIVGHYIDADTWEKVLHEQLHYCI